jgi:RNA polymerase sigma-70 factor (ECF subfamily)
MSVQMDPMTPEDALLAAAQAGEMAALSQLLRAHRHGVYRYGLQVCRTTEDAEDALQETLWAATRAIGNFRGSASSIVSWMFTMIRRECFRLLDRHRKDPVALGGMEDEVPADGHDAGDALVVQRRADQLVAALQSLEPSHREVVLLRDIEELSAPEAAARLGISVKALKSRLHRARVNLRDHVLAHADHY